MDMPFMVALKLNSGGSDGSGGKDGVGIASMDINEKGELVIVLTDGRVRNLGRIVGADGAVYVPHVDDQRVLSFTIEKNAGDVPDPVKLGGSGADSTEVVTDKEVKEMLEEVFGTQGGTSGGSSGESGGGTGEVDDDQVVTDAEIAEMLKEVFGS